MVSASSPSSPSSLFGLPTDFIPLFPSFSSFFLVYTVCIACAWTGVRAHRTCVRVPACVCRASVDQYKDVVEAAAAAAVPVGRWVTGAVVRLWRDCSEYNVQGAQGAGPVKRAPRRNNPHRAPGATCGPTPTRSTARRDVTTAAAVIQLCPCATEPAPVNDARQRSGYINDNNTMMMMMTMTVAEAVVAPLRTDG